MDSTKVTASAVAASAEWGQESRVASMGSMEAIDERADNLSRRVHERRHKRGISIHAVQPAVAVLEGCCLEAVDSCS